ncbi:MAG: ATP synthase F1 subunit delta [Bacteroidota bacterium]|nr:ATP synthase F1 subunit delta [Bacteroidota bacterium]
MSQSRVAARYALSLFTLAKEQEATEQVKQDVDTLLDLISNSRDFELLLLSPVVNADKKWQVFQRTFEGKVQDLTLTFIRVVMRKRREMALADIFEEFVALYNESKGILTATLTTAVPVSSGIEEDIKSFLQKKTGVDVELTTETDNKLLGGFVLKYKDKLVDASVATKLKDLRRHLVNQN